METTIGGVGPRLDEIVLLVADDSLVHVLDPNPGHSVGDNKRAITSETVDADHVEETDARDPVLEAHLEPEAVRQVSNYLTGMLLKFQPLAGACGKSHVLNLKLEDLMALAIEVAAMDGIPLAGPH